MGCNSGQVTLARPQRPQHRLDQLWQRAAAPVHHAGRRHRSQIAAAIPALQVGLWPALHHLHLYISNRDQRQIRRVRRHRPHRPVFHADLPRHQVVKRLADVSAHPANPIADNPVLRLAGLLRLDEAHAAPMLQRSIDRTPIILRRVNRDHRLAVVPGAIALLVAAREIIARRRTPPQIVHRCLYYLRPGCQTHLAQPIDHYGIVPQAVAEESVPRLFARLA